MVKSTLLAVVLKARANCWGPVFLILASFPLLIHGKQPKQNVNIPFTNLAQMHLLYHFHRSSIRCEAVFQVKASLGYDKAEMFLIASVSRYSLPAHFYFLKTSVGFKIGKPAMTCSKPFCLTFNSFQIIKNTSYLNTGNGLALGTHYGSTDLAAVLLAFLPIYFIIFVRLYFYAN